MKRFFAMFAILTLSICAYAQRSNTVYVDASTPGKTQGDKITNAQKSCNTNVATCVVIIDSIVGNFAKGTDPEKCATCIWMDYRTLAGPTSAAGNGVLNASQYSGADIGAKINDAISKLPTYNGKAIGTVTIPAGSYSYATGIVINSPYVHLDGQHAVLNYTGSGTAILLNDDPTSYDGTGGISRLVLNGTSSGKTGIVIREVTYARLSEVAVTGFTSGVGIAFETTSRWTENTDLDHVRTLDNAVGIQFADNCTGHSGCPSFAYTRFRHVVVSVPAGGVGVQMLNDANINGGDYELSFFLGEGATAFWMKGTSAVVLANLKIKGEITTGDGSTNAVGIKTDVGTNLQTRWEERWNAGNITDAISGNVTSYANWPNLGAAPLFNDPNGVGIGNTSNDYYVHLATQNLTNYRTLSVPDADGTIAARSGAPTVNRATCWKSANIIGYCSSVVSSDGSCTCN